jgi:hypothetical protein
VKQWDDSFATLNCDMSSQTQDFDLGLFAAAQNHKKRSPAQTGLFRILYTMHTIPRARTYKGGPRSPNSTKIAIDLQPRRLPQARDALSSAHLFAYFALGLIHVVNAMAPELVFLRARKDKRSPF